MMKTQHVGQIHVQGFHSVKVRICHISEPFRGAVFCDDLFSILRDPGANSGTAMSDTGVSGENNL